MPTELHDWLAVVVGFLGLLAGLGLVVETFLAYRERKRIERFSNVVHRYQGGRRNARRL